MTPWEIIQLALITSGITLTIQRTDVLTTFVPWWRRYKTIETLRGVLKIKRPRLSSLLSCPPCLAFWVGGILFLCDITQWLLDFTTLYSCAVLMTLAACRSFMLPSRHERKHSDPDLAIGGA